MPALRAHFKAIEPRRVGDIFEDAAERGRAVKRPLRTAQHLDPRKVERVEVAGQDRAVGKAGARPERHFVHEHGHGRGDAAGVGAAQGDARLAGLVLLEAEAGNQRQIVLEVRGVLALQRVAADHRDRLRNLEQDLLALLRGDDDRLLIIVGDAFVLRR